MLLYNNSTLQYVADLELVCKSSTAYPTAVALIRFSRDTNLPQDTLSVVNGVYKFTAYRQYDDLDGIMGLLQNKNCTVSFGMPSAGVSYPQSGFSIIAKSID